LFAFPKKVRQGDFVVLIAVVNPPDARGMVQFKDGDKPLGAPQPMLGSLAFLITTQLTVGDHQLTATFIPADPTAFKPSTSNAVTVKVTRRY
jgi:hypothetical protein